MAATIQALSISRVLAVFDRSCLLAPHDGEPLSLVLPELGDGPLNVVVEAWADAEAGVEPGLPASLSRTRLESGSLMVDLTAARVWEPRPAWPALRAAWPAALSGFECLTPSFAEETQSHTESSRQVELRCTTQANMLHTARRVAGVLAAGWAGDTDALRRGVRRLAGLGVGLTPAGDDFLAGLMLRAWLVHPGPEDFCRLVVEAAAPRTTALSAAFLRAAARGECSAAWHALLATLAGGGPGSLDKAVRGVVAHGHTSGADTLAGFLWRPD